MCLQNCASLEAFERSNAFASRLENNTRPVPSLVQMNGVQWIVLNGARGDAIRNPMKPCDCGRLLKLTLQDNFVLKFSV